MRIEFLSHAGTGYSMMTPDELAEAGVPASVIADAAGPLIIAAAHDQVRAIGAALYTRDPVQAAIYEAKFAEAQRYIAAGKPANVSADDYPFLTAEAPARGLTKGALADLIVNTGQPWLAFAAQMEAARARISADVAAAATIPAKQAAADAVIASLTPA